jgi:hypothetical protein
MSQTGRTREARQQHVREEMERYLMTAGDDDGPAVSLQVVAARMATDPRATAAVWARYADEWWYRPDTADDAWLELEEAVDAVTG